MTQSFLILVLVMALLGGVLSKCAIDKSGTGSFLSAIGLKSKSQLQKEQLNKYMKLYLKDQDSLLGDLQNDIGPLSAAVRNVSANNDNVDILRLKHLMATFEDQNVLMIQDGKKILSFSEGQKKINKKQAEKMDTEMFLSRSNQAELLARQKDTLNQIRQNNALKDDPVLAQKVDALYNKSMNYFDSLQQKQQQMQNMTSSRSARDIKDKIDDQRRRNEDLMRQNQDRMRDQMDRIKDRSSRI